MKRRQLGKLEVGAVGLGCMSMTPIYGEPSEPEAIAAIHHAVELGVDLIDTSGMPQGARSGFLRNIAWIGGATTVLALFTMYELVTHSSVYGKFSWESILTLVIVLGAGPVIYAIARSVRRQRNSLDLAMAMHELPPE